MDRMSDNTNYIRSGCNIKPEGSVSTRSEKIKDLDKSTPEDLANPDIRIRALKKPGRVTQPMESG